MTTPHPSQPDSEPPADQAPSSSRSTSGAVVGGRYTLLDPLGAGGMGAVWRAHDDLLRRDVAVKEVLLPPGIPRDEQAALYERTLREARAAAGLSHPSVIRVYDVITDNGRPWIIMELLQARSVADMISRNGGLPPRAIAKIGLSVLGALETAHAAGVLHRDVKPANVLICSDGRTVLTDFGVARIMADSNSALTSPGMVLGSPQYISPERATGAEFGPPSDLFSLGVTLYTAAEGRPPFDRGDPLATMHAVVYEEPDPPRRAGPLTPILLGLLAKEPTRRWDVQRTRDELRTMLSGPLSAGAEAAGNAAPPAGMPAVPPPSGPTPTPAHGTPVSGPPGIAPSSGAPHQPPGPYPPAYPGQPGPTVPQGPNQPMSGPPMSPAPHPGSGAPPPGQHQPPSPQFEQQGRPGSLRGTAQVSAPSHVEEYYEPAYPHPGYGERHRRIGPWLVAAGAAGVAILLVIIAVGAGSGWFSGQPEDNPTTPASAHTIDGRTVRDAQAGFSVSVPKEWKASSNTAAHQYADPSDATAWIKFPHRKARKAAAFLRSSGHGMRSSGSYRGYHQIALRTNLKMAGKPAAELEYTLVSQGERRHGIWRVIVVRGHTYEVYMSVPQKLFAKEKPVFEQAVQSFSLG